MTKNELLYLANKGKTEIAGYPLEVKVFPCCDEPWIEIRVDPLSHLHQPLILGQKWVEYITDDECSELVEWLNRYKAEADSFCEEAKTVVKATMNNDGTYSFTEIPEKVKDNFKDYPSAYKKWAKQKHRISPIKDSPEAWYAPGTFSLDLDGVIYVPHWSYWLNCAYYESTPQTAFTES